MCITTKAIHHNRKPVWVWVLGVLAKTRCALPAVNGMPAWAKAHATLKKVIQQHNQHLPEDQQQFIGSHNHEYLQTFRDHLILWKQIL